MSATNRAADKQLLRFSLRLSFRNTILNLYLRVQTTGSGAAVDNLNFRLIKKFPDVKSLSVTDKEIQARNEARIIPQNRKRGQLQGVHFFGTTERLANK